MDTVLEQQRSFHEERERLVDVMSKEMCFKPSTVIPVNDQFNPHFSIKKQWIQNFALELCMMYVAGYLYFTC